jgi:predicted phosphodiesterase
LLEGVDEVIFNGDTCEQMVGEWSDRGTDHLEKLKQLCVALGVGSRFLTGNHDPDVGEESWLDLKEGRIFVTHGDLFFPEVAPWNREYLARRSRIWKVINEFDGDLDNLEDLRRRTRLVEEALKPDGKPCLGAKGEGFLWTAIWPPRRPLNILRVWATMFAEAERFVERYRPASEVVVFGHFHRPGIRERGGRIYCNTGAFMRGARPWLIDLRGGWLEIRTIETGLDGEFVPGVIMAAYRLEAGE